MSLPDELGQLLSGDGSGAAGPTATAPGPKAFRRSVAVAAGAGLLMLTGAALLLGSHVPHTLRSGAGSIVALSADAGTDVYTDFLKTKAAISKEDRTYRSVGPLPWITDALKAAGKDPPQDLVYKKEPFPLLSFNGSNGALLLPSLDMAVFPEYAQSEPDSITFLVGVNSDSYNRGLGVAIEPPPGHSPSANGGFVYNGLGLTKGADRNVIKFHPDFYGGQLRIEGAGGFDNQNLGFKPKGWTNAKHELQGLEITLARNGTNTLVFVSPDDGPSWTKTWQHKLLGGTRLPSLYAWLDLGGEPGKPLMIGNVSLVLRKAEKSTRETVEAFVGSLAAKVFEWR